MIVSGPATATAQGYVPISGAGSTWSSNALDQWRRNVDSLYGITVQYSANGSSQGRNEFKNGTVDFAVSEIEYGPSDGGVIDYPPTGRNFGYMPIVAGGTSFMYNLKIGNLKVTNLRLSGEVLAKIFTQKITTWADAAIKANNPGLTLPARKIVPVVRSDGSGTTAQFTRWLASQHGGIWDEYCRRAGRQVPCGSTSNYPLAPGMEAKATSQGVAGFVASSSSEGAITYVEYSYAKNANFPLVHECLTKAGLWHEVRDRLRQPGGALSGGQQQRLCIARSLAVRPQVLLMDEPCSALDPTSTRRIEQTIEELAAEVTIVIVTHNMRQAARVSQKCAFFLAEQGTPGVIVETGPTEVMFNSPSDPCTADYVHGRFG